MLEIRYFSTGVGLLKFIKNFGCFRNFQGRSGKLWTWKEYRLGEGMKQFNFYSEVRSNREREGLGTPVFYYVNNVD